MERTWEDWRFTERQTIIVLTLYVLADHETSVATQWLQCLARRKKWSRKSKDWVVRHIEDLVLSTPENTVQKLGEKSSHPDPRAFGLAWRYLTECQVMQWVKHQNVSRGVAPTTRMVLDQVESQTRNDEAQSGSSAWGAAFESATRGRVYRWRRFWQGSYTRIRVREDISKDTVREKVCMKVIVRV